MLSLIKARFARLHWTTFLDVDTAKDRVSLLGVMLVAGLPVMLVHGWFIGFAQTAIMALFMFVFVELVA